MAPWTQSTWVNHELFNSAGGASVSQGSEERLDRGQYNIYILAALYNACILSVGLIRVVACQASQAAADRSLDISSASRVGVVSGQEADEPAGKGASTTSRELPPTLTFFLKRKKKKKNFADVVCIYALGIDRSSSSVHRPKKKAHGLDLPYPY